MRCSTTYWVGGGPVSRSGWQPEELPLRFDADNPKGGQTPFRDCLGPFYGVVVDNVNVSVFV